jgi:signal transduction histidine kinase
VSRLTRLTFASRIFALAAVLGLSLAQFDPVALQGTILLAAVSATAMAADLSSRLPESGIAVAEGALSALVIGLVLPQGFVLLPYLVVPTLVAGVGAGAIPVLAVVAAQILALNGLLALSGGMSEVSTEFELVAPWLLTSLGVGLLGAWLKQLRLGPAPTDLDASYESAKRLLSQLRTVARRLSSGLDTVTLASQLLVTVHQHLSDTHSAVFVRTEGGVLAPIGYRGTSAKESLRPEGPLVDSCWAEMEPAHGAQLSGLATRRYRIVLPLRVASRMVGVVISELPDLPSPKDMTALMREVDEQALRLDTALTFDEVRSIATMEERQRLAREIHDGVAQEIASLGYAVDDLTATASTESQRKKLHALRAELSRVVSELRLSIFDLRSEISPSAGLGSALSDYIREVGSRSGMTVHLTLDEAPTRLRAEVETELLRIVQEAVTNARKHSAAENLWVDCRIQPPFARIRVRDDGAGLGAPRMDSFGLRIMRERAERINAALDIQDHSKRDDAVGTSVTVTVGAEAPTS